MSKNYYKTEDAPANSTGSSVSGTGDDGTVVKNKKKKKKKWDLYSSDALGRKSRIEGKNMDQLHDLIKQGKTADEISKIMKLDVDAINALMEESVDAVAPNITPDSQFAGVDVFNVNDSSYNDCKFGKKKHERWSSYVDMESDSGKRIYGYAKKNPNKSIIVQHDKTGHMLYLKKYDMGGES